jgi:tRNA threonylcarbamoyladenosine biosynthesis protein TsaB
MAVSRGAQRVAMFGAALEGKRSERLWSEADFLLGEAGLSIKDVHLFAACTGPGGFTGLRVGIAAVKGLALATGSPAVGVTSLEALAAASGAARSLFVMINAYKGEVYSQLFSFGADALPIAQGPPVVTTSQEAIESVAQFDDLVFTGDGALTHIELIKRAGGDRLSEGASNKAPSARWRVIEPPIYLAEHVARLAFSKFVKGEATDAENLRACYVRQSDAELKLSSGLLSKQKR